MSKQPNAYRKNFDDASFKEVRPVACGILVDKSGVYLTGFRFWEGDVWQDVANEKTSVKGVFKFAKCKTLFGETDVRYSHKAIINEERQWGMACYYAPLSGIDPKTFKYIKPEQKSNLDYDGFYFRDSNSVYYLNSDKDAIFKVASQSPETFFVHDVFAQDEKSVFFKGKKIAKSLAASFRKLDGWYRYEDDNFIYENDNWARVRITAK